VKLLIKIVARWTGHVSSHEMKAKCRIFVYTAKIKTPLSVCKHGWWDNINMDFTECRRFVELLNVHEIFNEDLTPWT
jgi:hypothetical protein